MQHELYGTGILIIVSVHFFFDNFFKNLVMINQTECVIVCFVKVCLLFVYVSFVLYTFVPGLIL